MENGFYGMDEVEKVVKQLVKHLQDLKVSIMNIAEVICMLRDIHHSRGRYPESYVRVMKRFLNK